ncbi:Annexin [Dissoconium aciculare CBS 342.82]|uniref:Annexin n=1 Tax=Dissoconium aciculare CBS 342.82 TaxID=1314786 RepID=A0A6J3M903_9PEZI|nr:Annexin [Dissoconium aciculare CBS 342.82]KAF1824485.1 Annexin [Dissoconium aciculare CBS 342.82]
MSLRPDDRSGRQRSGSTVSGRTRDRSRSNVRAPEAPEPPSALRQSQYGQIPPPSSGMPGGFDDPSAPRYEIYEPSSVSSRNGQRSDPYETNPRNVLPYPERDNGYSTKDYGDFPPPDRFGNAGYPPPPPALGGKGSRNDDDDLAFGDEFSRFKESLSRQPSTSQRSQGGASADPRYAPEPQYVEYAPKGVDLPPHGAGIPPPPRRDDRGYPEPASGPRDPYRDGPSRESLSRTNSYGRDVQTVEMAPRGAMSRHNSTSKQNRLSIGPPESALVPRMNHLSVGGGGSRPEGNGMGGGMPPPSPLLEAYRGTYQSISPMPLALRPADDSDLSDLEPLDAPPSRGGPRYNDRLAKEAYEYKSKKKHITIYSGEDDAKTIAAALKHHNVDTDAICDVLPGLTHDNVMELRKEYKKLVKVQGKGVNISKHIKTKITGNFGKAVYIVSLGRWESEGYWANFWYQSHGSRRELLIESLMGRTNAEIRMIKDDFKDKRYGDSLTRCMEKELKMDKFRTAVLMVLEERRQEEQDSYPTEYIHRDVEVLNRAVRAEKGGETAMLEIIVRRSDAHLREVLRSYEKFHRDNFAREALRKSGNLVGEVIAHILNGVINKPARDALLLQHAIQDIAAHNKDDELRYELLISRLVRLHWDRAHLTRVKREYYDKYRITLEQALDQATKGEFREFVVGLCATK